MIIFTAFYGEKWHWMMTASFDFWHEYVWESNQYCLTLWHQQPWFFSWICLRVKLILFDHLPPFTAVFKRQQPKKLWKWPFLRHFTAKNDTELWQLHLIFGMNMSQSQTNTVWLFATCYSCFFNINNLKNCENDHF